MPGFYSIVRRSTRSVRPYWREVGWTLKMYGIAYGRERPREELVEAAKQVARERLTNSTNSVNHYGVGFLGVHDGRGANFVFVDYWADENELHHHVYVSPSDDPASLEYVTPTPATCEAARSSESLPRWGRVPWR